MGNPYGPPPASSHPRVLPFVVDLRTLHHAEERQLEALALLQPGSLLAPLVALLREAAGEVAGDGEEVRGGERMIRNRTQGEIGIFLQRGWSAGASVALLWHIGEPFSCQVRVAPCARATRVAVWASGALALPLGFVVTKTFLGDAIADPKAKMLIAMGLWVALWILAMQVITRLGLFSDVAACEDVVSRLRKSVGRKLKGKLESSAG